MYLIPLYDIGIGYYVSIRNDDYLSVASRSSHRVMTSCVSLLKENKMLQHAYLLVAPNTLFGERRNQGGHFQYLFIQFLFVPVQAKKLTKQERYQIIEDFFSN